MKILLPLLLLTTAFATAATAQAPQAPTEEVTLTGTLQGGRIAAGGETTGWALQYRDATGAHTIDVFLPPELRARARSGAMVRVTGTFATQDYVERGPTRILRARSLEDAAATASPSTAPSPATPSTPAAKAPATTRLPELSTDQMTPSQRALADEILKVSSVGLGGPYDSMLRSPEMGERMFKMLDYLRFNTSVPRRLNEFAILIQARLWTSQVEWAAHYPLALKAGISEATAADLKVGRRPSSMKPDEAAVYDFCMELSTTRAVSDATYAQVARFLSGQQVIDLVTVSGTYTTLAMMMSAQGQTVPAGATPLSPLPSNSPSPAR